MENLNLFIIFLKKNRSYILLRNSDVKKNIIKGGDADILVFEFKKYLNDLLSEIEAPLMCIYRSSLYTFYWKWGHIDIHTSIEFRGANYISNETMISKTNINSNNLLEAPIHIQALVCWITNLLSGGFFKMRYKKLIIQAAHKSGEEFYNSLEYAIGSAWAQRMLYLVCKEKPENSEKWIYSLRLALWWRAFRRAPYTTLIRWACYRKNQVLRCINPPAPWITILGLDGSGKSTIARNIKEKIGFSKPFTDVRIEHWRPSFFHNSREIGPVIEPHGKSKRGKILSLAKLGFLILDWLFGFWQCVQHPRAKGQLVIFDRHYVDLLVDPRRYRYGAPLWAARLVGALIPKPDLFILLDLPAEVARSRKPEVSLQEAQRLRERYLVLAQELRNARVVDASRPLDEVIAEVEDIILTEAQRRTTTWMCRAGLL